MGRVIDETVAASAIALDDIVEVEALGPAARADERGRKHQRLAALVAAYAAEGLLGAAPGAAGARFFHVTHAG